MNYEELLEKLNIDEEGRIIFRTLHYRTERDDFRQSIRDAYDAFLGGNDAFRAYVVSFAKDEYVPAEHMNLYLTIVLSEPARDKLRSMGMDDEVFYDSLSDVNSVCLRYKAKAGIYGIDVNDANWYRYALEGTMFRFGRLQFQLAKSEYSLVEDGVEIKRGEPVLFVHVPAGDSLSEEACNASYKAALPFFKKYFGFECLPCFCYSWLLQPWLDGVLAPNTNIINFKATYRLIETIYSVNHTFMFIFPGSYATVDDYPVDNPLRREAIRRLRENEFIGYGVGVRIVREDTLA